MGYLGDFAESIGVLMIFKFGIFLSKIIKNRNPKPVRKIRGLIKNFFSGVSNAWRKLYRTSRKHLKFNLFTINGFLMGTLGLWYKKYDTLRLLDAKKMLREGPKMEVLGFQVSEPLKGH